jgi:hypothetical protein
VPGRQADQALSKLVAGNDPNDLVQTWAAAARIGRAETLTEIREVWSQHPWPALQRPLQLRTEGLIAGASVEELVRLSTDYNFAAAAGSALAARGDAEQLVDLMYSHPEDSVRRQATALAGGLANQDPSLKLDASVPGLHKIDDRSFEHLAAAIDAPIVTVRIYDPSPPPSSPMMDMAPSSAPDDRASRGMELARDEVRVVKEEAIGMYEVAVLAAGSAKALDRWMTDNAFRYPNGMDDTVEDYVVVGWLFVAIKARVASMGQVAARPGMRGVDDKLPAGSRFDGYVQGMAFRFRVDAPVIPMRLSTFNGDDTHNRVYVLSETPVRIREVSDADVRRQISGSKLYANLTTPLPLKIENGGRGDIDRDGWAQIEASRSPDPYVAVARDMMASDLLAVSRGELTTPYEEREKELLRISEALSLRGAEIDLLHEHEVEEERAEALEPALRAVEGMTYTVIDGDFVQEVLRDQNLTLATFGMPPARNRDDVWTVRPAGPTLYVPRWRGSWRR